MTKRFYAQPFLSYLGYLICFMFFQSPSRKGDSFLISFLFLCLCAVVSHFTFKNIFSKLLRQNFLKKYSFIFFVPSISIIFLTSFLMHRLSICTSLFSQFYSKGLQGFLFCFTAFILCAYCSSKKPSGILNFCCFSSYILPSFFIFLFFSIKKITPNVDFFPAFQNINFKSFKSTLIEGIFIFFDIAIFHFLSAKNTITLNEKSKKSHEFSQNISLFIFIIILFLNCARNIFSFGGVLLESLDFPELSAIKLVPHFHFPEIYLFILGLCTFIKISSQFCVSSYLFDISVGKSQSTISRKSTFASATLGILFFVFASKIFDNNFFDLHSPILCALCIICIIFFYILSFFFSKNQNIS